MRMISGIFNGQMESNMSTYIDCVSLGEGAQKKEINTIGKNSTSNWGGAPT